MKKIYNAKQKLISVLGTQKIYPNKEYRLLNFVISDKVDEGIVFYNNFTKSMILLENNEIHSYEDLDINSSIVKYLIEQWFLVPEEFNELKVFDQLRDIVVEMEHSKDNNNLASFVILPTTDCNARCYYCYQEGCKKITMDKQRAKDVANFIIKKSGDAKKVLISWFGGEPLVGYKAIDVICQTLKENNFKLRSSMTSNGYLFNESIIDKAINLWNLVSVQITLDGTEEMYNEAKSYITNDISPFTRVINNIELLIKYDISVAIRLNLSPENEGDIEKLVDYLHERFSAYKESKKLGVYVHTLFQELMKTGNSRSRSDKTLAECYKRETRIDNDLIRYGLYTGELPRTFKINYCMADGGHSMVILPDGTMNSCEHFNACLPSWGNIYNDDYDTDIIEMWKKRYPPQKECATCPYYPSCLRLKHCPSIKESCCFDEMNWLIDKMHTQLKYTYKQWLKHGGTTEQNQLKALSD